MPTKYRATLRFQDANTSTLQVEVEKGGAWADVGFRCRILDRMRYMLRVEWPPTIFDEFRAGSKGPILVFRDWGEPDIRRGANLWQAEFDVATGKWSLVRLKRLHYPEPDPPGPLLHLDQQVVIEVL